MSKISVVVPVYKVERYLHRCIDSILAQTFTDFDLILVDDGSPDNCGTICDEYAVKDSRVMVIHQQNGGLSAARNVALDWVFLNSNSEWITFVDSDDWLHNEYLSALYSAVKHNKNNVSMCRFLYVDEEEKTVEGNFECDEVTFEELYSGKYNDFFAISACAKLYKKEFWQDIRFPVGKLHEDLFVTHKVLFKCEKIVLVNATLYYCYRRADSITHSNWNIRKLDEVEASEAYMRFFKEKQMTVAYHEAITRHFWVIKRQMNELDKSSFRKKKQIQFMLRNKLRKLVIRNVRFMLYEHAGRNYFLETAFPGLMWCYWTFSGIKEKIKHLLD